MSKNAKTDISQSVMEQIKHGKVSMRPRVYFTLLTILSVATVVLASIVIAYLTNIISFWWRVQSAETMAWGARANLSVAIDSFPWGVLVLAIAMLVLAVWLVKKQGTMYRYKTWMVVVAIVAISLLVGLASAPLAGIDGRNSSGNPGDNRQDRRRSF